jgi:hypothetical protein
MRLLRHPISKQRAVAAMAITVAIALSLDAPVIGAYAASPVPKAVRTAAYTVVAKVGRHTHATGTRVLGCRRSTAVRYFCQVQNSFRTGATRCVADVKVTLDKRSHRAPARITNYVCY